MATIWGDCFILLFFNVFRAGCYAERGYATKSSVRLSARPSICDVQEYFSHTVAGHMRRQCTKCTTEVDSTPCSFRSTNNDALRTYSHPSPFHSPSFPSLSCPFPFSWPFRYSPSQFLPPTNPAKGPWAAVYIISSPSEVRGGPPAASAFLRPIYGSQKAPRGSIFQSFSAT